MDTKPVIRVIGSLNIDFVTNTPRVPGPGETLTATSLSVNAGGKGANQAVACGKAAYKSQNEQDVEVDMVGAVGENDPYYASLLKPTLERSGVKTSNIIEMKDNQTGTATILVEESGENRILIVPGANHAGMKDLSKLIEIASKPQPPSVLVMQGEIPRDTTIGLLRHFNGKDNNTNVIFNPAPVFPEGIPSNAISGLYVLVVNETECLQLADSLENIHFKSEDFKDGEDLSIDQLHSLADQFQKKAGVKTVIITLGSRGVYFSNESGRRDLIKGMKVDKVVDTTAAGDTFVGYFAAELARHLVAEKDGKDFDISTAVTKANAAAAKCVQRPGAMQSIPFGYE